MCIKTVYHNTYVDGDRDVTERVDACLPGRLCASPRIREFDRTINATKLQMSGESAASSVPLSSHNTMDPRSLSPNGSDADRRHPIHRSVYVNGVKIVDVRRSRDRMERSPRRDRTSQVLRAPEPPAPRPLRTSGLGAPISFQRATTMPYHRHNNAFGLDTSASEPRGRAPLIIEERVGGPVDSLRRRHSKRDDAGGLLSPHMHYSRETSPVGYSSAAEDARERQERRRRRRELRERAAFMPSSAPTPAPAGFGGYASSWGSSSGASSFSNSPTSPARNGAIVEPSPAVAAVKKLRWEDQQRAAQNARIRQRAKLPKEALHGEVKSILKNTGNSRVVLTEEEELDQLRRKLNALDVQARSPSTSRESSAERRARLEREDQEELEQRLRNRFSMPPRRFTTGFGGGPGAKRRSEVWYPEEGRYKYL